MSLREAILKTLVYFDLFDYPLTSLEVWRFLYAPGSGEVEFEKVLAALDLLLTEKKLDIKNGFYFLPERAPIVEVRATRYALSFEKYRRAKLVSAMLSLLPGVRAITLGNTMAWRHARAQSDLDFFIITSPKRIWTTRILAVLPTAVFGVRPKADSQSKNAVCLSFFAAEDALNLRSLMIPGDIYLPYWIASIVPLTASPGVFEKFKNENSWIKEYLPNIFFREPVKGIKKVPFTAALALPQIFERIAKKAQIRAFPQNIKKLLAQEGTGVIASDQYLKFHTDDRREFIRDAWRAKVTQLL